MCDEVGHATGWQLLIAVHTLQHRIHVFMDESLEELGISFAQLRILELLDVRHDLSLSELARHLRVTRQAVRLTTGKLAAAGLVDIQREPHASYVMMTDVGRRRLRRFRGATHPLPEALEAAFTPGQRAGLIKTLRTAENSLDSPKEPLWWLSA
jgi:DNA-binding MarR family transcriptional regulator